MSYKKAFTLVELLVTVAILTILLLISVPIFHSSREIASRSATIANHRVIVSAATMYWHENHIMPTEPCDLSPYLQKAICAPCSICSSTAPGMNGDPAGAVYEMFIENVNTDTFLVITAELDGVQIAIWREII